MKKIIIFLILVYQKAISPCFNPSCRYIPTCSGYMIEAINRFGILKGLILGIKRIMRCHPFSSSGYDPVPKK